MASSVAGKLVSALCGFPSTNARLKLGYAPACMLLQTRHYAARKGTREKAKKKKVKVEVKEHVFIPHNERNVKALVLPVNELRYDDSWKRDPPTDNVWIGKYYKWKVYSFEEAVTCQKETHQLGMLDAPDAYIRAYIELDMTGPKPTKPVTKFARTVATPHRFDHGESRNVAVFCKTPELQEDAIKAGATLVGGPELITRVQAGDILLSDYDYVLAHPNMMAELVVIKGLMRRKFPSPSGGTLGADIAGMTDRYMYGIKYAGNPHKQQLLYGICEAVFGRLDMDTKQLEENFAALISDINAHRPKREGPFITRIRLMSAPSNEFFQVDYKLYTNEANQNKDDDDGNYDDEEEEGVAAAI